MCAATLLGGCASGPVADPPCLQGDGFVADGPLPAASAVAGDARMLQAVHHETHEGCERITLALGRADDTPAAAAGQVQAELLRDAGVVRVSLPDVDRVETAATDAAFAGPLGHAAYVVRSPDGPWLFADIHLGASAEARIRTAETPGRVLIDLRPGTGPVPPPAPAFTRLVILSPRGPDASYPLVVTGYARTFEANVVVRLEQNGADAVETFTTATGWVDAWGHYSLTIDDGPRGPVTLHAGEYSARDGTWEGVAIDLALR